MAASSVTAAAIRQSFEKIKKLSFDEDPGAEYTFIQRFCDDLDISEAQARMVVCRGKTRPKP